MRALWKKAVLFGQERLKKTFLKSENTTSSEKKTNTDLAPPQQNHLTLVTPDGTGGRPHPTKKNGAPENGSATPTLAKDTPPPDRDRQPRLVQFATPTSKKSPSEDRPDAPSAKSESLIKKNADVAPSQQKKNSSSDVDAIKSSSTAFKKRTTEKVSDVSIDVQLTGILPDTPLASKKDTSAKAGPPLNDSGAKPKKPNLPYNALQERPVNRIVVPEVVQRTRVAISCIQKESAPFWRRFRSHDSL